MGLAVRQSQKGKTFEVCLGHWRECSVKKGKGKFLYIAVSNRQDCSKRFTFYFPGRPVQSHTITTYLGNIQPYAAINARKLLVHIHHLSIARYSSIQQSELEQCRVKKPSHGFNTAAQDSNPDHVI